MNKPEMLQQLRKLEELGFASDLYNTPNRYPDFMPFTIAALVLCDDLKKVPSKVSELIKTAIEHDLLMNNVLKFPVKPWYKQIWSRK